MTTSTTFFVGAGFSTPLSSAQQGRGTTSKKDNREICQEQCKLYQAKFPDITYLSSDELVEMHRKGEDIILVDVRTEPEREISMLEGALTKDQFLEQQQQQQTSKDGDEPLVVTYCTIGYRSGLEARRLGLQYPEMKDRIRSLDGCVSYTHALGKVLDEKEDENDTILEKTNKAQPTSKDGKTPQNPLKLVDPKTGESTNQVHTFGGMWGCIDDKHFEATHFSIFELLLRMLQVMIAVITCTYLRIKTCCCPPPRMVG